MNKTSTFCSWFQNRFSGSIQVRSFNPELDIPYYTPCGISLYSEIIKTMGYRCDSSLFVNLNLFSIPVYIRYPNPMRSMVDFRQIGPLLGYKSYFDYLGGIEEVGEVSRSFTSGLKKIRDYLRKNELVIVAGTTYHLPHFTDQYHNPKYIEGYPNPALGVGDHLLIVYGMDHKQVFVYDPIPNRYLGPVPMKDFSDFWRGNRGIPELASVPGINNLFHYGSIRLIPGRKLSQNEVDQLYFQTLKTVASEYLQSREIEVEEKVVFFGANASKSFANDLSIVMELPEKNLHNTGYCLGGLRFIWCFFRDLIRAMQRFGEQYGLYLQLSQEIVNAWEYIHNSYWYQLEKGMEREFLLNNIKKELKKVASLERRLMEEVEQAHRNTTGLEKK